jgi:WD40 repeat protein
MLDEIVHNLESSTQVSRIKKLVFCACTNNWSNEAQNLSTVKFKSYIQQLYDLHSSIVDLKYAFYRIVIRLNHSSNYYTIANLLCEEMGKLYAADRSNPNPPSLSTLNTQPSVPSTYEIIFLASESQAGKVVQIHLQILAGNRQLQEDVVVSLPNADLLFEKYQEWQSQYRRLDPHQHRLTTNKAVSLVPERINECLDAGAMIQATLHQWYSAPGFQTILDRIALTVKPESEMSMTVVSHSKSLLKLPWNLVWQPLLEKYPQAEIALVLEPTPSDSNSSEQQQVRILSILASAQGIKIDRSRDYLDALPNTQSEFVVAPGYQEFVNYLSEHSWSVLFISSYISGYLPNNRFYLNHRDTITISEFKYRIQVAVQRGVKILILNCGDGLEFASELADIQVPYLIVMREAVQDQVAQEFMKLMLKAFANGKSVDLATREAREKLQAIEKVVPAASWLPVMCHPRPHPPQKWAEIAISIGSTSNIDDLETVPEWGDAEPTGILSKPPAFIKSELSPIQPINYEQIALAQRITGYFSEVYTLGISPDDRWLVSGHGDITHMDDAVKVWQLSNGKLVHNLLGHRHWIYGVAIASDSETIVSGSLDGTLQWWQLLTGTKLERTIDTQSGVNAIAMAENGQKLITGGNDALLKIWQVADGKLLSSSPGHAQNISCLTVYEGSGLVVTGSSDYKLKLWELLTGKLKLTLESHTGRISSVAITPDGTKLVSASYDLTIKIWEIATGRLLHTLSEHTRPVNCILISPDGKTIVSGSEDRIVNFWSLESGHLLHSLPIQDRAILSLSMTKDGKTLVTGGYGEIQVWRVPKISKL